MSGTFDIYECLNYNVGDGIIMDTEHGDTWNMCRTDVGYGIALRIPGNTVKPMFSQGLRGLGAFEFSQAVASWNFEEAGMALAAVNSVLNTEKNAARLNCRSGRYTDGLDLSGKIVGVVGHFRSVPQLRQEAKELYVLEREPQDGDYPDSACDWILPKCDIVLITGCSITNKTLPHLLTLCENAYTVLTGPSVPLCRELFDFGIDRLAGTVVTDADGLRQNVLYTRSSPVSYGKQFILSR